MGRVKETLIEVEEYHEPYQMNITDIKCSTCEHGIFDERWGEYKCVKRMHRVYSPDQMINCEFYKKKKEKTN